MNLAVRSPATSQEHLTLLLKWKSEQHMPGTYGSEFRRRNHVSFEKLLISPVVIATCWSPINKDDTNNLYYFAVISETRRKPVPELFM